MTTSTPETDFTLVDIATYGTPKGKQLRVSHIEGTKDCYMELIEGKTIKTPLNSSGLGSLEDNIVLKTKISYFWTFFREHDTVSYTSLKEAYTRELRKVYHGRNRTSKASLDPYLKHFREFNESRDY
jgi:hypothetical protein